MMHIVVAITIVITFYFQLVALPPVITPYGPQTISSAKSQKAAHTEAARLWEQAIAAKCGRERLYGVHNMVISSHGGYTTHLFKKNQVSREALFVFPNKYWFWDDYRPDVFGLVVSMYNYDNNASYTITSSNPLRPLEQIPDIVGKKALRNAQLSLLLETKWLKPIPVKTSTGSVGLRPVDIVQTTVHGERVDFAFDRKTHLTVRVSYHDIVKGKTYIAEESFSDYTDVGGIKVPQTIKLGSTTYKQSYQFNVEYNEDIFIKPPLIEAGPEAWKIAKR